MFVKIPNEVYGNVSLDVSVEVKGNEESVFLEAHDILNEYDIKEIKFIDNGGNEIKVEVHNVAISFARLFVDGES